MAISLVKGQKISLEKEAGRKLTQVVMGLGWDVRKKKSWFFGSSEQQVDLDSSCIMLNEQGDIIDAVWFRQLKSKDGSVVHTGDNRTGDGDGDDEQIVADLTKIPANVYALVFTVNSFTGQNFSEIENAFCRVIDKQTKQEIAKFNLSAQGSHTAQLMLKLYRHEGEWKVHAIGENTSGRTFNDLLPAIRAVL
ncbi:TerD family protein [Desulfobulbus sp. F4]|nr:TerD family protein [Desulfobulbus sp. F4]